MRAGKISGNFIEYQYYFIDGQICFWDGCEFYPTYGLSLLFDISKRMNVLLSHGSFEQVNARYKKMEIACRDWEDLDFEFLMMTPDQITSEILDDINLCLQTSGRLPKFSEEVLKSYKTVKMDK